MGTSPSPVYKVSIPRFWAAVSDNSTIMASTKTCARLISSLEIRFLIPGKFDSSEETIREFVFSWCVITVFIPSGLAANLSETLLSMVEISSALAYLR